MILNPLLPCMCRALAFGERCSQYVLQPRGRPRRDQTEYVEKPALGLFSGPSIDLFAALDCANPLFPKAACRFAFLSTPTIARLLEMGSSLQVLENPVLEHQSFKEANRSFDTALSDRHLQRAAARCVPAVGIRSIASRTASKRHARLPGDATGFDGAACQKNEKRHEAWVLAAPERASDRLNRRQVGLYGDSHPLSSAIPPRPIVPFDTSWRGC
jgi:hypothetical protein